MQFIHIKFKRCTGCGQCKQVNERNFYRRSGDPKSRRYHLFESRCIICERIRNAPEAHLENLIRVTGAALVAVRSWLTPPGSPPHALPRALALTNPS